MVADNFQRSLRLVLVDEGGRDDDKHDHGGRTAFGIIQREYDGYRARHGRPLQDVWLITPAEYTEIYHDRYWNPWCDRLPAGVDYAFFDACVNAGPGQAAKTLQKAIGVRVDGFMGDVTLGKVHTSDPATVIRAFCEARRQFYRALAQFPRYGRGWLARVNHVENGALAMAVAAPPTLTDPNDISSYYDAITNRSGLSDDLQAQATAKAKSDDVAKPPVSTPTAATATTTMAVGAGYTEQLSSFVDKLSPFQDTIHIVKYILLGLTLIGLGLTVYSIWHAAKTKEATG